MGVPQCDWVNEDDTRCPRMATVRARLGGPEKGSLDFCADHWATAQEQYPGAVADSDATDVDEYAWMDDRPWEGIDD